MIHAQNKQRIYSILVRILLNSSSEFTQFCFEFYSIWVVKVLNSKLQSAPKAIGRREEDAHAPSPAEPARFDSRGRVLLEETAENG